MVVETFLAAEPSARLLDTGERLNAMQDEGSLHPQRRGTSARDARLRGRYLQTLPGCCPAMDSSRPY